MNPEWKDKWVRATNGSNVLEGKVTFQSASGVDIQYGESPDDCLTVLWVRGWVITEIPEPVVLPTKPNAVMKLGRGYFWRSGARTDDYRWVDDGGDLFTDEFILDIARNADGMTVIFEGVDE